MGLTDYELLRVSYEIGQRGIQRPLFHLYSPRIRGDIPLIFHVVMYMLPWKVHSRME
jgi:hypothetical protein